MVKLRISGLNWRGTAQRLQNNITDISPGDNLRATIELPFRTPATHFWLQIRSLEAQNGLYTLLFKIWYGFGIINLFSWIFNGISSEKSYLVSMPFLLTKIGVSTVELFFFPLTES